MIEHCKKSGGLGRGLDAIFTENVEIVTDNDKVLEILQFRREIKKNPYPTKENYFIEEKS